MADKTIQCKDCGKDFAFTEGEQSFYTQKGFSDPVRCVTCRRANKAKLQQGNRGYNDRDRRY